MARRKAKRNRLSIEPATVLKSLSSNEIKLQIKIATSDYTYKFGSIIITLNDDHAVSDTFTVVFNTKSSSCCVYWEEKKDSKVQVMVTAAATCEVPFGILQSLSAIKIFFFIAKSHVLQSGDNIIEIYINPMTFVTLHDASEFYTYHHRNKMFELLKYFLKVEFDEYDDNYLYEEKQVEKIYNAICNHYDPGSSAVTVSHDFLIPNLRPYQSQAVQWMLKRENPASLYKGDSHVLYMILNAQDGRELHFHKYGGFFVDHKYSPDEPCKGGILADEMGLGKTLEVLACILMNPKSDKNEQDKVYDEHNPSSLSEITNQLSNQRGKRKNSLSDDENTEIFISEMPCRDIQHTDHMECVCGCIDSLKSADKLIIKCGKCGVMHHAECVLYIHEVSPKDYTCPYCWSNNSVVIPSRATLIISPAAILHQWKEEISKHIKEDCLKVFVYQGVEHHKFIEPTYLADYDIVLTSYETLKKELNYVDLPHVKLSHSLRHPKKFVAIPSPMLNIEWWRICLDEAQMVETVTTKIAKMTRKLHSVNRWCVTGTPIKKSVEDLYGLLLFLEAKPYNVKLWWKEVLWKPYVNGDASNISSVLKDIAWRTIKQQVLDQVQIPELQEVIHKLEFSPLETVFYNSEYSCCKKYFCEKTEKFDSLDIKLKCIDKQVFSKVMFPLRHMQLACSVYNVRKNSERQRIIMKPKELLNYMLNRARYECEETLRKMLMALNGLGGIYALKDDYQNAVDVYEKALKFIEDNKLNCRTDITQQVHILFMLSKVVSRCERIKFKIKSRFDSLALGNMIFDLTVDYMAKNKALVLNAKIYVDEVQNEIHLILDKFKLRKVGHPTSIWWIIAVDNLGEDKDLFLKRIEEHMMYAEVHYFRNESVLGRTMNSSEMLSKFRESHMGLHESRYKLKSLMDLVSAEPSRLCLNSAISCHLRPEVIRKKCIYCEADDALKEYETKLYRFAEASNNLSGDEENIGSSAVRRGTRCDSDLELFLRCCLRVSRTNVDLLEDGTNELKLLDAFKREYKYLRNLWLRRCEYIAKQDEIEMAKIATRFPRNYEILANPIPSYIILSDEVPFKMQLYQSNSVRLHVYLEKKLGHLFYLQNLEKAENKDAPFDEFCPICQQTFENKWSVLQCGHSFCLVCMDTLHRSQVSFTNILGYSDHGIRCPVCRHLVGHSDVYFIDKNKEEEKFDLEGYHSTKTSAVIRCLLSINESDPTSKSLVFSSFTEVLSTLEAALFQNNVKCLNLCKKTNFQDNLKIFKEGKEFNILLIPLTSEYSGLNITEANNVLLVEPTLDDSKHLQAIGRIHRIGQMRKTTVHRFVVSNSIEESIQNLSTNDDHACSEYTLQTIKEMFQE